MSARPEYIRLPSSPGESLVRELDYVLADDLSDTDETFDDELIERTLGRNALAAVYGDTNSGKTFLTIDMGAAVCRSTNWMGRPTAGGLVLYLATESPASVQMRLRAYKRHHRVRVPGFVIVRSPINLFDGDADITAVIALVEKIEQLHGDKVALIIGDTLARISAGANENNGDMGVVMMNADAIRQATGATFLWIHHCGKDQARGMRGWSGMSAMIDSEIEVVVDETTGVRSAEITKQRDLPGKGERLGFRLEPVHLGLNRWGTPRGSCVVVSVDPPAKAVRGKRVSEISGAITEFLTARGTGCAKGAAVKHFEGRYVRQSVYKEINKMIDAGMLIEAVGIIALPGKPGPQA
jgi:KaiC/GvpD/RAD55 family RecA-like ATPase